MATTLSLLKPPILSKNHHHHSHSRSKKFNVPKEVNNTQKLLIQTINHLKSAVLPLTTVALPFFLDTNLVRMRLLLTASLKFWGEEVLHSYIPLLWVVFSYTLCGLGIWDGNGGGVRTIQNEITELKKQLKPTPVTPEGTPVEAAPSPGELKIQQLTEEGKELLKGSYRDRHYNAGSILLGFGVFESTGGGVNTWFRTGKLMPGPHLFPGAAITALWAAAASLVPATQKGNETARDLHIALNALNVLLIIW